MLLAEFTKDRKKMTQKQRPFVSLYQLFNKIPEDQNDEKQSLKIWPWHKRTETVWFLSHKVPCIVNSTETESGIRGLLGVGAGVGMGLEFPFRKMKR